MQHKDYWAERFDRLTEAQINKGAEYYRNLEDQYRKAIQSVEKDIAKWYTRYATKNGISLTEAKRLLNGRELEEFRMDVKEYIQKGETLKYSNQWAKQLEAASTKFHVSRLEALKVQMQQQAEMIHAAEADALDSLARNIYTDGYYKTAYEIQKGIGVGFDLMQLDTNKIDKLIAKPWAADGKNFSERIWNNRAQLVSELENRLTQSIIRGQSPQKVIKELAERFNVSKSKAGRLVMTESAFFASAAQRDAFNDLDVERYEVLATLDSRTSETCRRMDGQVIPMSEYKPGVTAPPFHVYCRSTTVPYFDDEFTVNEQRAARGENGEYYTVPADMKYEEWKKTFVNGGSKDGLSEYMGIETTGVWGKAPSMISKEEYEKIRKLANESGVVLDGSVKKFRGDIGLLEETIGTVKQLKAKYPLEGEFDEHLTLAFSETMLDDDFAYTNKHLICFNAKAFRSKAALEREYAEAVDKGWFPKGTTYKNIIVHEYGHVLNNMHKVGRKRIVEILYSISGAKGEKELSKFLIQNLSEYSASNSKWGEVLSEALNSANGSQPSAFALKFLEEYSKIIIEKK